MKSGLKDIGRIYGFSQALCCGRGCSGLPRWLKCASQEKVFLKPIWTCRRSVSSVPPNANPPKKFSILVVSKRNTQPLVKSNYVVLQWVQVLEQNSLLGLVQVQSVGQKDFIWNRNISVCQNNIKAQTLNCQLKFKRLFLFHFVWGYYAGHRTSDKMVLLD